ncbi:hypothetical protein D3C71_1905660 [compost metagenome]
MVLPSGERCLLPPGTEAGFCTDRDASVLPFANLAESWSKNRQQIVLSVFAYRGAIDFDAASSGTILINEEVD